MDVVGLNNMRSQTTSYLSCVNTCLTGLGASATDQFLWTYQSFFCSPLCDASREIRGAFLQASVFSSARLNTRSTRNTRASCGNNIFTTLPSIESAHHLRHNWSMEGHHQGHTVSWARVHRSFSIPSQFKRFTLDDYCYYYCSFHPLKTISYLVNQEV